MNNTNSVDPKVSKKPECWGCGACDGAQRLEWMKANPASPLTAWLERNPSAWPSNEVLAVFFP